jgi:HD superfamily phosphohydrolase
VPTWGLTNEQRRRRPWGIDPRLLEPGKVTTDPVHGDVHTTVLEQMIIDTPAFQRLRRVRQLGTTHLVYPGAVHTRFSHSLGALRVVQDLLDGVIAHREGLHRVVEDWFSRRRAKCRNSPRALERFKKEMAEAIVLARLGALLHDIGHIPFGRSIEDDLRFLEEHDKNRMRFNIAWDEIGEHVIGPVGRDFNATAQTSLASLFTRPGLDGVDETDRRKAERTSLLLQLEPLIISKATAVLGPDRQRFPWVADLVGDTICADLLDYLLRDHLFTGLPASLGKRFASAFFVVPEGRGPYSERVALSIVRDGHERADVVSELLKALRYRYELSERVLTHHAKLAADAMVGKALELWESAIWLSRAGPIVDGLDDLEIHAGNQDVTAIRNGMRRLLGSNEKPKEGSHADWRMTDEPTAYDDAVTRTREELERAMRRHGDDGLLEMLAYSLTRGSSEPADDGDGERGGAAGHHPEPVASEGSGTDLQLEPMPGTATRVDLASRLMRQSSSLARDLLERKLYRQVGRVGLADAPAGRLHTDYGDSAKRIALQEEVQRWAGLGCQPRVLIWLPSPEMRLKLAEVLVDDGEHVDLFVDYERARSGRGSEIYDAHFRLWAMYVFVHRDLGSAERRRVIAFLARRLGVCWERERRWFGPRAAEWVDRLIVHEVKGWSPTSDEVTGALRKRRPELAARQRQDTYAAERQVMEQIIKRSAKASGKVR